MEGPGATFQEVELSKAFAQSVDIQVANNDYMGKENIDPYQQGRINFMASFNEGATRPPSMYQQSLARRRSLVNCDFLEDGVVTGAAPHCSTFNDTLGSPPPPPNSPACASSQANKSPGLESAHFFGDEPQMNGRYSRKVFIGGLPPDLDEESIRFIFSSHFGSVCVDWPHKEVDGYRFPPSGYAFLCFESEESVLKLLQKCQAKAGKYYCEIPTTNGEHKQVQIRPWAIVDGDWQNQGNSTSDHTRSVFIGGVPRTTTASELAGLMNKKFGDTCRVQIEVDNEWKYPKGAARVAFSSRVAYATAVSTRFLVIKTPDYDKKMEMKPFLVETSLCNRCQNTATSMFCNNVRCLQYFCDCCWTEVHQGQLANHKPIMKNTNERQRHHQENRRRRAMVMQSRFANNDYSLGSSFSVTRPPPSFSRSFGGHATSSNGNSSQSGNNYYNGNGTAAQFASYPYNQPPPGYNNFNYSYCGGGAGGGK